MSAKIIESAQIATERTKTIVHDARERAEDFIHSQVQPRIERVREAVESAELTQRTQKVYTEKVAPAVERVRARAYETRDATKERAFAAVGATKERAVAALPSADEIHVRAVKFAAFVLGCAIAVVAFAVAKLRALAPVVVLTIAERIVNDFTAVAEKLGLFKLVSSAKAALRRFDDERTDGRCRRFMEDVIAAQDATPLECRYTTKQE